MGNQPFQDLYGDFDDSYSHFAPQTDPYATPDVSMDPLSASQTDIPPVRLRTNVCINTLNHGVYSSWDNDLDGSLKGQSGLGAGSFNRPNSVSKQKYGSLDLLKILYDTENDPRSGVSLDMDIVLGAEGGKDVSLPSLDNGFLQ